MPEKGILKGVDGDVSVSVSRDSQKPVKISVSGEDGGDLGSGHSSEIDFFDEYHVPYELPPYIHRPCPCGLQVAMYVMGGGEVVVNLLIIWIYTTFYTNVLDPKNLGHYENILVRAGKGRREDEDSTQPEDTKLFIAQLCTVQIMVCVFHCLASIILIIGASKKNIVMCGTWMFLVICFILIRVVVTFLMPIRVFGWGNLWILMELYFLYAAAAFIRETHFYPQGYVYKPKQAGMFSESEMRMVPVETEAAKGDSMLGPKRQAVYYQSLA